MATKQEQDIIPVAARNEIAVVDGICRRSTSLVIQTEDDYNTAGIDLKEIKLKYKQIDDLRKSLTKPIDETKKRIMDIFSKPLTALEGAEAAIKNAMIRWQQEQERIRQAEEARLREIQRQAEEKARKEAEAKRIEEQRLCKLAEEAIEKGDAKKAEAIIAQAETVSAQADAAEQTKNTLANSTPVVESTVSKISGIGTRKIWKYRIIDETKIPRQYLIVNEKLIGQIARTTQGKVEIEGVEFYAEDSISAGVL
jgi:hypothetical protein